MSLIEVSTCIRPEQEAAVQHLQNMEIANLEVMQVVAAVLKHFEQHA